MRVTWGHRPKPRRFALSLRYAEEQENSNFLRSKMPIKLEKGVLPRPEKKVIFRSGQLLLFVLIILLILYYLA